MKDNIYPLRKSCKFVLTFAFLMLLCYSAACSQETLGGAKLTGIYKDRSVDLNGDGLYDLIIDITLDVKSPGEYTLMGSLYDLNYREVVWSIDHANLSVGSHIMQLRFDGKSIEERRANGPYLLRNLILSSGSSYSNISLLQSIDLAYKTSSYNYTDFVDPINTDKVISGEGHGEILLTISGKKAIKAFEGRYSLDVVGIHMPPISSEFSVIPSRQGYAYDAGNIDMPMKPNDFLVRATGVKNLNIGIKKSQGSYENSTAVWESEGVRTWVTSQYMANNDSVAEAMTDLISPGIYHAKIFGDATHNDSWVNLTMTFTKNIIVDGKFSLIINTEGLPSGVYSISAKAKNVFVKFHEISVKGLTIADQ